MSDTELCPLQLETEERESPTTQEGAARKPGRPDSPTAVWAQLWEAAKDWEGSV